MADQDFGDLVLREQLLELTVRNGLDLGEDQPQVLDQHHAEEGRKDVPDGELVLALLGLLRRLLRFRLAQSCRRCRRSARNRGKRQPGAGSMSLVGLSSMSVSRAERR